MWNRDHWPKAKPQPLTEAEALKFLLRAERPRVGYFILGCIGAIFFWAAVAALIVEIL